MPVSNPAAFTNATLHEPWTQVVDNLDTFVTGDTFELKLTTETGTALSGTIQYTVKSTDTAATVVAELKSLLDTLAPAGYTFSVSGTALTITRSDRQAVVVEVIHNTAEFTMTKVDDPRKHYNTANLNFTDVKVQSGVKWVLRIGENSYDTTPRKNSKLSDVVSALKTKAQTGGYTISEIDDSPTNLRFSNLNGSSIYLEIGTGTLTGLLDIDQYINAITGNAMPPGLKVSLIDESQNLMTLTIQCTTSRSTHRAFTRLWCTRKMGHHHRICLEFRTVPCID